MTDKQIEQIIDKHHPDRNEWYDRSIIPAIKEAVEKGSIEFSRWVMGSISPMHVPSKDGLWEVIKPSPKRTEPEYKTDEQLYKEYLKSLEK